MKTCSQTVGEHRNFYKCDRPAKYEDPINKRPLCGIHMKQVDAFYIRTARKGKTPLKCSPLPEKGVMRIKDATSKDFLKGNTARRQDYTVWFEQVNAGYVTVKAANLQEASEKAKRFWRKNIGVPRIVVMEDADGKVVREYEEG